MEITLQIIYNFVNAVFISINGANCINLKTWKPLSLQLVQSSKSFIITQQIVVTRFRIVNMQIFLHLIFHTNTSTGNIKPQLEKTAEINIVYYVYISGFFLI